MANKIQYIDNVSGDHIFPVTHERGVIGDDNVNLETKLSDFYAASEAIKELQNSDLGNDTVVNIDNYKRVIGLSIDTNDTWKDDFQDPNSVCSIFIPLNPGTYQIDAVDGLCVYAVLTSTAHEGGTTPDFSSDYPTRYSVSSGASVTIVASNGNYLWTRCENLSSGAYLPRVTRKSDGAVLKKTDVIDNLSGSEEDKPLSANQGRILNTNDINAERVKVESGTLVTVGQDITYAGAAGVQTDDFRAPNYPPTGYAVRKVYVRGKSENEVTIGIYTPGSGISGTFTMQMVDGVSSADVSFNIPAGSYLCIGNAIGLAFTSVAAQYGLYNITQDVESPADVALWFEAQPEITTIKNYVDNKIENCSCDSLIQLFPKLTGIGDSLMAGYTKQGDVFISSAEARAAGNNWPTYIAKRNGLEIHNLAIGSSTAHHWRYADGPSQDNLADISTANIATNCYFIGLGVNDLRTSFTVGTSADIASSMENNSDTFYGNLDFVVRKCLAFNPRSHIFIFTIPNSESGNTAYNNAIKYIANLYDNVHYIDLATKDDFTTGIINACKANGHYDPLAYNLMSSLIEREINKYIKTNYSLFKVVPY